GVVMEALESGDVAMAKEKLDKYHQLANSGADVYVEDALKQIDPNKFINKPVAKAIGFNKIQIYDIFRNVGRVVNFDDLSVMKNIKLNLVDDNYNAASMKMTKYMEDLMLVVENRERVNPIYKNLSDDIDNFAGEFAKRKKINKVINKRLTRLENTDDIEDAKKKKEENMNKIKGLRQEFEKKYGVIEKNSFAPVIQAVYMGDSNAAKEAYESIFVEQMKKVNNSIETLKKLDKSLYIGGGNKAREYDEICGKAIEYLNRELGQRTVKIHDQDELDKKIDKLYYSLDNGSFVDFPKSDIKKDSKRKDKIVKEIKELEKMKNEEEKLSGCFARKAMTKLIKNDNIRELKVAVDNAIDEWDTATPGQRYEWQEYEKGPQYDEEFIDKLKYFKEAYLQDPNDLEQLRTSRVPRQDMSDFVVLSYLQSKFDSEEADRFLDYYKNLEFSDNEDVKKVKIYYDTESENGIGVKSVSMTFLSEDGKTVGEVAVPEKFNSVIDAYQLYYRLDNDNLSI
ncbi:MAG: hypothetical protein GOV02_02265, partial [Candidatus Aenigmarchaeota archaeon]|nr:hypothetical protein [Candidatus Aenigmarchaeota archaeon]